VGGRGLQVSGENYNYAGEGVIIIMRRNYNYTGMSGNGRRNSGAWCYSSEKGEEDFIGREYSRFSRRFRGLVDRGMKFRSFVAQDARECGSR
jgi:hypothetical protein